MPTAGERGASCFFAVLETGDLLLSVLQRVEDPRGIVGLLCSCTSIVFRPLRLASLGCLRTHLRRDYEALCGSDRRARGPAGTSARGSLDMYFTWARQLAPSRTLGELLSFAVWQSDTDNFKLFVLRCLVVFDDPQPLRDVGAELDSVCAPAGRELSLRARLRSVDARRAPRQRGRHRWWRAAAHADGRARARRPVRVRSHGPRPRGATRPSFLRRGAH